VTALSRYANEIDAVAEDRDMRPSVVRKLRDIAYRMRRDATIKPNPRPFALFGAPPISGGREVRVERRRRIDSGGP
jgi:hypothetical protein